MKVFIINPTDFLRRELRDLNERFNLEDYHEYSDGVIRISGDIRIDNISLFGGALYGEMLKLTYYHDSVEKFQFCITKPEFTHLEVRL
jgi:hypothetical protein